MSDELKKIKLSNIGSNEFYVYSDEHPFTCLHCSQVLTKGFTASGYCFMFDPKTKKVHPVHATTFDNSKGKFTEKHGKSKKNKKIAESLD